MNTHTNVGQTREETQKLLEEHNSFKEKAKETREKVKLLLQLADTLMEKGLFIYLFSPNRQICFKYQWRRAEGDFLIVSKKKRVKIFTPNWLIDLLMEKYLLFLLKKEKNGNFFWWKWSTREKESKFLLQLADPLIDEKGFAV